MMSGASAKRIERAGIGANVIEGERGERRRGERRIVLKGERNRLKVASDDNRTEMKPVAMKARIVGLQ